MAKVSQLYTLYLKSSHLPKDGSIKQATIEKAEVRELHPRPGVSENRIVLSFKGRPHVLILNGGNANKMASIGGDDTEAWTGLVIGLKRGKWGSNDTIIIEPVETE